MSPPKRFFTLSFEKDNLTLNVTPVQIQFELETSILSPASLGLFKRLHAYDLPCSAIVFN
jgi:hypothetical protein